ncbi:MAG TPA: Gfo/Idh/MocA family oxidoreductase [Gemmatimonadaceae bacterium]|nr:Gfo/Idh/MocA family oxidoreductase [Gemmatimonadaceae bacterium]
MPLKRKVRYGMVGGGPGAFIGAVHRKAAALDGEIELVAGAFSSDAGKSRRQGEELFLDRSRVYGSYEEMIEKERKLPEGERIDFVSIVTPNSSHFRIAKAAIEAGFHVVCDKPMTTTIEDAEELCRLVKQHDAIFALTHNYTGYPMVKQARELVRQGKLGRIQKIVAEYSQGWILAVAGMSIWRLDPKHAGISSAIGDIGVHALNLTQYVTGLELESICADLTSFGEGYELEDDANILVHFKGGARGTICASQISAGEENGLRLRVYGDKAGLDWKQENPNYLDLLRADGPAEVWKRGNDYLAPVVKHNTRIPSGHPEGFIEGFANVYRNAGRTIEAKLAGENPGEFDTDFPTVQDGARGVHFIHKAVESGKKRAWVDAAYTPPR